MKETITNDKQSVAEAYLLILKAYGINNLFMNVGTDFAPLVEAYAKASVIKGNAECFPKPILATHENVVIGMAHGAYLVSRKPQAAMFHVNVGTANAACGIINAAKERIPLFIAAGRTPYLESGKLGARDNRTNWGQEMFDQNALVREVVKWDYELHDPVQVESVMQRSFSLASSNIQGPVYLTLPREVLSENMKSDIGAVDILSPIPASNSYPDPAVVKLLAKKLIQADFPVISSLACGANSETVELLAELCERFAIGYTEELARYMNFPHGHPMHLGYKINPVFADADVLCFLESDVPWLPTIFTPKEDTYIVNCGLDPHFSSYPMRNHRCDLSITTDIFPLLKALMVEMESLITELDNTRYERIHSRSKAVQAANESAINVAKKSTNMIDYLSISEAVGEILHDDCVVFNEYYAHPEALKITRPGSYFFLPASGGLGWSLPAAIGAKLEDPTKTCVVTIGDGTYMFANPAACHQASQKHNAPVLTIICNNAYWNAVDFTSKSVYPDGMLNQQSRLDMADIGPSPDFEKYAEASGGYGEVVKERSELIPALKRAMHAVEKEGRQAVLNVICHE